MRVNESEIMYHHQPHQPVLTRTTNNKRERGIEQRETGFFLKTPGEEFFDRETVKKIEE